VDAVDVFTDKSSVPLSMSSECADLAGSVLHVCGMSVCPSAAHFVKHVVLQLVDSIYQSTS